MLGFIKNLTVDVNELKNEIKHLKEKLKESQNVINKTNAYWKKRVFDLEKKLKS